MAKKVLKAKDWIELVDSGENLTKKQVAEAFKVAYNEDNAELAYLLACLPPENTNRQVAEKIVLRAKNPHFCYLFARDIPNANVSAHQDVVLKSDDFASMIDFARDIQNANVKAIETLVLDAQNPEYSYRFVSEVENCNIRLHQKVVTDSKNEEIIKAFRDLEYDGINKRELNLALGRCTRNKNITKAKQEEKSM